MVDDGLNNFKNLQVLIICGNWIDNIYGIVFPRGLKFLELYVNEIKSVKNLASKAPKKLIHLGLARNRLTNDSALHLLGESGSFCNLKSLDLGECDICRLVDVLKSLQRLQNLESLYLQGNPCSMVLGYKDIVLSYFPRLIFLDGIEIVESDRKLDEDFLSGSQTAELILMCSKLTGLPKPPKVDKKIKQTIHVEFVMPLFQENTVEEIEDINQSDEGGTEEAKTENKNAKPKNKGKDSNNGSKGKSSSGTGGKKSSKKDTKKSLYDNADEYNPKKINNSFQSIRKPWNNNIKFPPILLKSPENNLIAYRDSFRSNVNVRVVYTKFLPPEKAKKKGKTKKDIGSKKSKKKEKSKKSDVTTKSDESGEHEGKIIEEKPELPTEKILKRVTLASFYCNLFSITWKDGVHFYWCDESTFGKEALELYSYLEGLKKEAEEIARLEAEKRKSAKSEDNEKSSKSKKPKQLKKAEKMKKSKKSKDSKKSKLDPAISCYISFGLSRLSEELKEVDKISEINKKGKKGKKEKK